MVYYTFNQTLLDISNMRDADFSENQSRMTVLKKTKRENGVVKIDYTHPNHDPSKENNNK